MSQSHSSFQDVGIFKKKKEGFNSRLPIPSLFRKSHTKQSPSLQIPTPSYPLESSPNNHSRGQSLDLRRPQPTSSPRKSFDLLDLRPRRFALSKQPISNNTQLESQLPLQSTPLSSSKPPRKSLGDSPTSPTVLLVERRKVRNPLPTFPESISEEIDDSFKRDQSIGSFRSQDLDSSSSSSSTSNSTTPTNQSDMAIFPSFGSNTNQSSSDLGGSLTVERLNRQRSTSQSSLTRKFSDEAKRLLGGNRDKSRERNLTLDGGMGSGLDGKALKRSSKTKDFDLRSHFMNSNQPISSPTEESTLKDYEQFSTSSNATTMKSNSKSPSKTSSRSSCQRPGSSDSNLSKSSIASSTHSNDSSSPIKKSAFRNRTTSSPTKFNSSTTPPPRSSSRSSSRQTSYGIGMTTSPIRTESGHGEESISPSKANTSFESSLLVNSTNSSPTKNGDGVSRPLLGSWLCEEEEDGEDASLQIILSNHRRSSSECSLDVLDRRNLALSYNLQYENRIDEDSQEEEEKKRLESNTFIFPLPPKTLKERHSHSSLRTSNKVQNFRRNHSGGSGPVPIFGQTSDPFVRKPISTPTSTSKPLPEINDDDKLKVESVFSNSNPPLRERRSKPPLTLSLKSSTFAENESRNRKVSDSSSSSIWSPPPCPPPSTPLPELPSSSNSIKNKSSFQFDRHSRSSSGNTPSSSPASNGILKYNTRPRSRTFSSSNGVSRPSLFELNRPSTSTSSAPSSENVNPIDLPPKEKKRVSFGLYDYSIMPSNSTSISSTTSSRPSSILSPSRDSSSSSSSDWSSPITPGFSSTSSSPAFQFKSLELVSRLSGNSQKNEDDFGNGDEEIEILKDDGLQLHCALGLEGIIGNNLNQFFEDQDLNHHHQQELESMTHQDDEIVYGFAM